MAYQKLGAEMEKPVLCNLVYFVILSFRIESIQQRLLNRARELKLDINILRVRYSLERFLYRLGHTKHKERFVLKGAMLFIQWSDETFRPTKDADFLIKGSTDHEDIETVISDICKVEVKEDDGMTYDWESVKTTTLKEGEQYEGIRVIFLS